MWHPRVDRWAWGQTGGAQGRWNITMRNDVCDAMAPRRPSQVHRVSSELHLSESPVGEVGVDGWLAVHGGGGGLG